MPIRPVLLAALVLALAGCGSGDLYQQSGVQAFDPMDGTGIEAPAATEDEILTVEVLGLISKPASVTDDVDPSTVAFQLPAVAVVPGASHEMAVEVIDAVGRSVRRTVVVGVTP